MGGTMIGFAIDTSSIKRLQKYIESFLIRYKIEYSKVEKPHISIAQITGTYDKADLIRTMQNIDAPKVFNPKEIHLFQGREDRDFIVIEYKANWDFIKAFEEVSGGREIRWFGAIKPHVSLFSVVRDEQLHYIWNDMMRSAPPLPKVKPKGVELWNSKFQVEFFLKK